LVSQRLCRYCEEIKAQSEFYNNPGNTCGPKQVGDIPRGCCKDCHKARYSKSAGYESPSAKADREHRAATKADRLAARLNKCRRCGEGKPFAEFGPATTPGRLCDVYCKSCRAEWTPKHLLGKRNKHYCIQCAAHMESPRWRDATRTEWICSDECARARKRDWKRKAIARRQAAAVAKLGYARKRTRSLPISDKTWDSLAERNAAQAWQWWLAQKAPDWWLQAHEFAKYAEKPWAKPGLTAAEQFRIRYRNDPEFRLGELLRNYRRKAERGRYGEYLRTALKKATSSPMVADLFGFTLAELRLHLERQFTKGMTWDRFNRGEIHIDHIRPLKSFNLESQDEVRAAWALANLQPLWAKDNLSKGAKLDRLI
jgi:hypothetical protein